MQEAALLRPISATERSLKGRTALVTGAAGFIGSHLVARLLAAGARVKALVRYNSRNDLGLLTNYADRVEIIRGDITDPGLVRQAVQDVEIVIHLAALIAIPYSYVAPASYVQTNVVGTQNLLQAALEQTVSKFIQVSTSEVYGSAQYLPMDEKHPLHPQSPYAASKVAADQLALSYYRSFELPVTVVRPFNTYGPGQSLRAVLPSICLQALRGDLVTLGNTTSSRDLTYVEDTCAGFLHAATIPESSGKELNLGYGESKSIEELVALVGNALNKELRIDLDEKRLRPVNSEVDHLLSDNGRASQLISWQPTITLDKGIDQVLSHLRKGDLGQGGSYSL